MKTIIFTLAIILFSVSAHSASWVLYFENRLGIKFYLDADSRHRTPEETILVWRKIAPSDKVVRKVTMETLYEVDCSRRRFKTLQGTIYGGEKGIEPIEKTDWEYFEPSDLSNTLFSAVRKEKHIK